MKGYKIPAWVTCLVTLVLMVSTSMSALAYPIKCLTQDYYGASYWAKGDNVYRSRYYRKKIAKRSYRRCRYYSHHPLSCRFIRCRRYVPAYGQWRCKAKSRRGYSYVRYRSSYRHAKNAALKACYRRNHSCYIYRCKKRRWY